MFEWLITRPMGFIIKLIYDLVSNYGLAIILFTVAIKLILLPLNVHSQKAMRKQQKIQPIVAELQKKYANDQEKMQREMMKLYKENNVSMMGGCLPMLIQMPVLIGLYQVIRMPLNYLASVDWSTAEAINKVLDIQAQMVEKYPAAIGNLATQSVENLANMSQIQLSSWCQTLFGANDPWVVNFNFLGMNLAEVPQTALNYLMRGDFSQLSIVSLLIIPILAMFFTWLSSKVTQIQSGTNKTQAEQEGQAAQMTKSMNIMMPLMTGFFTFTLPSGMGIYWIISSVVQILQQLLLNFYFNKKGDEVVVKLPDKNRKNGKKHR